MNVVISRSSLREYIRRRCAREQYLWNSSTVGNVVMQRQCKRELSISVKERTTETKGISVLAHKEYKSKLGHKCSLCIVPSFSKPHKSETLSSLSLEFRTSSPLWLNHL